jgi:hypothetical protein
VRVLHDSSYARKQNWFCHCGPTFISYFLKTSPTQSRPDGRVKGRYLRAKLHP